MSSPWWSPVEFSSFVFERNRYGRSVSEQRHIITTHEYHSYQRTHSPCEYRSNYCEHCPCLSCRRYRQPSYRHRMSRRQTTTTRSVTPTGHQEYYSSAHSIRDEVERGTPAGLELYVHEHPHAPQSHYQQQRQQQQPYQPHHFHDTTNEYERRRRPRSLQINRRSTREVQLADQTVPSTTNSSRQDEAVIKRRYVARDCLHTVDALFVLIDGSRLRRASLVRQTNINSAVDATEIELPIRPASTAEDPCDTLFVHLRRPA